MSPRASTSGSSLKTSSTRSAAVPKASRVFFASTRRLRRNARTSSKGGDVTWSSNGRTRRRSFERQRASGPLSPSRSGETNPCLRKSRSRTVFLCSRPFERNFRAGAFTITSAPTPRRRSDNLKWASERRCSATMDETSPLRSSPSSTSVMARSSLATSTAPFRGPNSKSRAGAAALKSCSPCRGFNVHSVAKSSRMGRFAMCVYWRRYSARGHPRCLCSMSRRRAFIRTCSLRSRRSWRRLQKEVSSLSRPILTSWQPSSRD